MTEKDNLFLQKIRFLAKDNSYFGELAGVAKEMAAQNLCVFLSCSDFLLKKLFSETVVFCKFKTLDNFGYADSLKEGAEVLEKIKAAASGSVFFLDRIDSLSIDVQEGILELFENGFFDSRNILLITGSAKSVEELTEKNQFSAKLAFRLSLLKLNILSLSEIKGGARSLAWIFLNDANKSSGKNIKGLSEPALAAFENHYWRNGVFELKAAVDYSVSVCETEFISEGNLPFINAGADEINSVVVQSLDEDKTMKTALDSFKRYYVMKILEENGNNQTQAAKVLGLQRTYVSRLLNELHIR